MIAELIMGPQAKFEEFSKKSKADQSSFSGWQVGGWVRWLEGLRGMYERRMNRMCSILDEGSFQLKQGTPLKTSESDWAVISKTKLYSFDWPRGGMFVWVKVHYESHPLFKLGGPRLANAFWLFLTIKPHSVLVAPGAMFSPTDEIREAEGWKYFRLCFAAVNEDDVDKCSERFSNAAKAFWLIKDEKELEGIEEIVDAQDAQEGLVDLGSNMAC